MSARVAWASTSTKMRKDAVAVFCATCQAVAAATETATANASQSLIVSEWHSFAHVALGKRPSYMHEVVAPPYPVVVQQRLSLCVPVLVSQLQVSAALIMTSLLWGIRHPGLAVASVQQLGTLLAHTRLS